MHKLLLLFCLPALASAFGGTEVTWLGGSIPYDTVPHLEADLKLLHSAGSGAPALGAALDAGLTDLWMVQGQWLKTVNGGSDAELLTRLKAVPQPFWGLGASVFFGAALPEGGNADWMGGASVGWEGAYQAIFMNRSFNQSKKQRLSLAYWAPYLTYFLRPGLELGLDTPVFGDDRKWWLPQLAFNFPGDLSLDLGARFEMDGSGAWRAFSRLSYQLFPSP